MAQKLQISTVKQDVPFIDTEKKNAAIHGIELPKVSRNEVILPDGLLADFKAGIDSLMEETANRIRKAASLIDGQNGEGYTEILLALHEIKFSWFSAQAKNKAAKLLAVKQGKLDQRVMAENKPVATTLTEDTVIDMDI